MRAVRMREWQLHVDELDDPRPGPGQVLTRVRACGVCGSDLHLLSHGAEQLALQAELDADLPPDAMRMQPFDPALDVVMGHEFCCEVVELGPGVSNLSVGDRVVSLPVAFDATGLHGIGFSNRYNGGYAELMVLNEMTCVPVPGDLPDDLAALTEPLAVGIHAVAKSKAVVGDAAIVLGLGPVGLATIAELRMRGIGPIVGADFSPRRRALAEHLGADVVVDPVHESAITAWRRIDGSRPLVVFEAVGVPGMLDQAMRMSPRGTRICVVGACMQRDHIHPLVGIGRELSIQFALGYEPLEFSGALTAIAEERVDLAPLITAEVGLGAVPDAFGWLADPEAHAKIIVRP
jgi:threonine dehydrogenase-like Zn-dependent dehydrogenase